jgi:DNA (cytosine-5)-methyltransferase 1
MLFDEAVSCRFERVGSSIRRTLHSGRFSSVSFLRSRAIDADLRRVSPGKAWQLAELRGTVPQQSDTLFSEHVSIVDLFCGCGGFTTGVRSALRALGLRSEVIAAADFDPHALAVYRANHAPRHWIERNIDACVDYALESTKSGWRFSYPPAITERSLNLARDKTTFVIGGPPCQGHSNFNNLTRRSDPRNILYLTVPAIGIALSSPVIVIENVPSVVKDSHGVVDRAIAALGDAGYHCDTAVLNGDAFGAPQQRRRHFLLATRTPAALPLSRLSDCLALPSLTAWDAIRDLARRDVLRSGDLFDTPAELSPENQRRVDYLFDNDAYELPDHVRPDCHRDGHTYPSVYGRMHANKPAQTLTGGFMSPGRGRFVHPKQRRGLTPHEGARLQGFPDSFQFKATSDIELHRKDYAKMIGDAVPPPMSFAIALAALSSL